MVMGIGRPRKRETCLTVMADSIPPATPPATSDIAGEVFAPYKS